QTFLESNEMMKQMFTHSGVSIEESFTATIMMVMICLVSILPIVIVNNLFSEESRLHLSQIYATKITRSKFYWTSISIALLVIIGLAELVLGCVPKLGKLVYVYLTYSFLLNYFGGIVDLPEWFFKTAIQSWIPQMPIEDFDALIFITITVISIVLMVVGYLG